MLKSWLFTNFESRECEANEVFLEYHASWLEGESRRLLRQAVVAMDTLRDESRERNQRVDKAVAEVLKAFK